MGYNWQLSAETEILDEYISVTGMYETTLRPGPIAVTSQTFQRPLKVSVEMQVDPNSNSLEPQCVTMSVFPSDACFGAKPPENSRNGCGFAAGIGGWTNKFFSSGQEFGHGFPKDRGEIADMTAWHKVTIELVEDGSTKYYLNDVLKHEDGDSTFSEYGGSSPDEGRIAFFSCGSGRYKNLKVECPASVSKTEELNGYPWPWPWMNLYMI